MKTLGTILIIALLLPIGCKQNAQDAEEPNVDNQGTVADPNDIDNSALTADPNESAAGANNPNSPSAPAPNDFEGQNTEDAGDAVP